MPYRSLVAKLGTIADLRESDLASLIAICHDVRTVQAKRDILVEGERPEDVHVILEGWAARYKTLSDGSRQIVALSQAIFATCTSPFSGIWTTAS